MRKILMVLVLLILPAMAIAGPRDDFNKGEAAHENLNYEEAVRLWRKAANQGHAGAANSLGYAYRYGDGVVQNKVEAVRWFRKAANQGYAEAQFNLGHAYRKGEGVVQSDKEAVHWWRKAANQGYAGAQKMIERIGR